MGLDCSHDAWHGAYSAFNRVRQEVCKAVGGRFPHFSAADNEYLKTIGVDRPSDLMWYVPDEITAEGWPGLYLFLGHSDCDGEFSPEECRLVADDLERVLPRITDEAGEGHVQRNGGYRACVRTFIRGLRLAERAGERLLFR